MNKHTGKLSKKELKIVAQARQFIEDGHGDIIVSIWYYERKSEYKSASWAFAGAEKLDKAVRLLRKIYPSLEET